MLPSLASLAGLVCTGFATFNCHFLERDFYVTPEGREIGDFLDTILCERYYTAEECDQCRLYTNPNDCDLELPQIGVPEDYDKETQGIGFWNMVIFREGCAWPASCDTLFLLEESCQAWPKDAVQDFDGFWLYGRIMSLVAFSLGILACVTLIYLACTLEMKVKPFVICLHLGVGVLTILLLISSKSDLCSDSGVVFIIDAEVDEFPVAGCHDGTGKKFAIAAFCSWVLGAIGVLIAYKDPNEPSIWEKCAKMRRAPAATTAKQTTVTPHQEEGDEGQKEAEASADFRPKGTGV